MPLKLDVVTAERVVFSEDGFDMVLAPGSAGQLGLLPRHAPLMTLLEPGELRARRGADEVVLVVSGGFLELRNDAVTILADTAEQAEEIDVERAEAARRRAQESLRNRQDPAEYVAAQAAMRRALLRLRVVERRRRPRGPQR